MGTQFSRLVHPAKNMGESSVVRHRHATCASETSAAYYATQPTNLTKSFGSGDISCRSIHVCVCRKEQTRFLTATDRASCIVYGRVFLESCSLVYSVRFHIANRPVVHKLKYAKNIDESAN